MGGKLLALARAGALCAVGIAAPLLWIPLTANDCCSLRSPTLQEAGQGHGRSVPQRDFEGAIERTEAAQVDLSFAPIVELLPMPRSRPAATVILLAEARASLGDGPRAIGVRLDLWCMAAINEWLRRLGIMGTGSDLAVSVKHWGKPSKPVPGAIALKPRKGGSGHVVIVKAVQGKTLIAISPNHRGKVREAKYPLRVFYAFRAPA